MLFSNNVHGFWNSRKMIRKYKSRKNRRRKNLGKISKGLLTRDTKARMGSRTGYTRDFIGTNQTSPLAVYRILKAKLQVDLANMEELQAIDHLKVTAENSITIQKMRQRKVLGQLLLHILDLAEPK
jgi:hypothetical protein